jgi:hypothetical protein
MERIFERADVDDKLVLFNRQLDTAIDTFHVCLYIHTINGF